MLTELKILKTTSRGFRASVYEGVVTVFANSLASPMLVPLLIRRGATVADLGIYTMATTASTPAAQFPAIVLLDRFRTKRLYLMTGFILASRVIWLLMLLPITGTCGGVNEIMAMSVLSSIFGSVGALAWSDLIADLVKPERMGRAFAARNSVIALSTMSGFAASSYIFTTIRYPDNYIYSFAIGSGIMLLSTPIFLAYGDPKRPRGIGITLKRIADIRKNIDSPKQAVAMSFWSFSVNIAAAVWTYHMFNVMGADETWVTSINLLSAVLSFFFNIPWGRVYDKFGPKGTFFVSGIGASLVPAFFPLLGNLSGQLALQSYATFFWSGFNLAGFNYPLSSKPEFRHLTTATYNFMTSVFAAFSNYVGALLYSRFGVMVFYISAALRLASLPLLVRHTSNRGMSYEDLSIRSGLYKIGPTFRDAATFAMQELTYMFKLVYSIAVVVALAVVTVSLYSLAIRMIAP